MMPLVSVVILNYQNSEETVRCLSSLENQSYPQFEVILIDNASNSEHRDRLERYREHSSLDLKLITLDRNAGCAGGRNEGARHASGHYVAFLDSDTEVEEDWLSELVNPLLVDTAQTIGATTSTIRNYFQPDVVEYGGHSRINIFGQAQASTTVQPSSETRAIAGASFMLPRWAINELGELFSPLYFFWWEDLDVSWRLHTLGYRLLYVPTSVVFHRVTSRAVRKGPADVPLKARNKYLTFYRNLTLGRFVLIFPLLFALDLVIGLGMLFGRREVRTVGATLTGVGQFLRTLPKVRRYGRGRFSYLDKTVYIHRLMSKSM
jgi:GT2 family glycosyltransferase